MHGGCMVGAWDATHVTGISGGAGLEVLPPSSSPQTAAFPSGLWGDAPGGRAAGPPPLSSHIPGLGPWCLSREAEKAEQVSQ